MEMTNSQIASAAATRPEERERQLLNIRANDEREFRKTQIDSALRQMSNALDLITTLHVSRLGRRARGDLSNLAQGLADTHFAVRAFAVEAERAGDRITSTLLAADAVLSEIES